ncbi:PAS domain-containing protein [Sporosarcina siberiensis]|uniref:PAS domain-containing protein n=1 Tax=Sporosarcina siberiensis TaxID=1365606 RepID=A0ABW4SG96_9BACL
MKNLTSSVQLQLLEAMLDGSRVAALITDPSQHDNPIIFANNTFEKMTGYPLSEVIGQNCRFLQGEETDPIGVGQLRKGIQDKIPVTVTLKNYKKDGTMFWNRISVSPLVIDDQLFFTGTQTNISLEFSQRAELMKKDADIELLSLPILKIQDNIAVVTLIGEMTPDRFNLLTQKLTTYIQKHDVENVILDITGLFWSDNSHVQSMSTIQDILKLMGGTLYVTGITPKVAQSLAGTTDSSNQLRTFKNIQQALKSIR